MDRYFFRPRVGKNYEKGIDGLRTLIVGSHFYCPYHDCIHLRKECASSSTILDMDLKCPYYLDKEDQNYYRLSNSDTIEIDSYLEGFPYPTFSAFTYIMLNKRDHLSEEEKCAFWDQVAFTNYIQHYWPDGNSPQYSENETLYDADYEAFAQVVSELKPHLILVWNEAIKDCLLAKSNLKYFGMIDMPVLSVYLFSNNEKGTELSAVQEKKLLTKYNIIPDKITKAWIESLFKSFFNNQDIIEQFGLKTIAERSSNGMEMARTRKIKNIATLFKQLATQKILIRIGERIAFGNGITNKHKEVFMKYIKQAFEVPTYTNECMSQMFGYNFCHYHVPDSFEDNMTKKMKAVFMMVDTRDKAIYHRIRNNIAKP